MLSTSLFATESSPLLPTRALCKKFRELKYAGAIHVKNCSPGLQEDFKKMSVMNEKLFLAVEAEESKRSEFPIDVELYKKRLQLERKISKEKKRYQEEVAFRDKTLNTLDTDLSDLHNAIIESVNKNVVNVLDVEVGGSQLNLQIGMAKEKLDTALEAEYCLVKYLMPCFLSKGVKEARQSLKRLEAKQVDLSLKDVVKEQKAKKNAFEEKREAMLDERKKIWRQDPVNVDESLIEDVMQLDGYIEDSERSYYTSVNRKTMFCIVCMYEAYLLFFKKLESEIHFQLDNTASVTEINASKMASLNALNTLFLSQQEQIHRSFSEFWCPESGSNKAMIFHLLFADLSQAERLQAFAASVSEELMEKLIPDNNMANKLALKWKT